MEVIRLGLQDLILNMLLFATIAVEFVIKTLKIYIGEVTILDSITAELPNGMIFFIFKFLLSISFLILIRGGIPRYRYDFLTKLGWLKFISLILFIFLSTLCLILLN